MWTSEQDANWETYPRRDNIRSFTNEFEREDGAVYITTRACETFDRHLGRTFEEKEIESARLYSWINNHLRYREEKYL